MMLSKSTKIYIEIIVVYALLSALNVFLPQGDFIGQYELPASKPVMAIAIFFIILVLYGGLGFIGLKLSKKLGFAEIWDKDVTNKQRFYIPALIGLGIGIIFIFADLIFNLFHSLDSLPHPPFPTSLVASITAGIGEELIFRLFFISFWVWLISFIILKKKRQNQIFWIVAVMSALAFSLSHLPSAMIVFGWSSFDQIPLIFLIEVIFLNGLLSIFSAEYFRKYGFLAAIGIHFWADFMWHVVYGII